MSAIVANLDKYSVVIAEIAGVDKEIKFLTSSLTTKKKGLKAQADALKLTVKVQARNIPMANRHAFKGQTHQLYHQEKFTNDFDALKALALAAGVDADAVAACTTSKSVWGVRKNTTK